MSLRMIVVFGLLFFAIQVQATDTHQSDGTFGSSDEDAFTSGISTDGEEDGFVLEDPDDGGRPDSGESESGFSESESGFGDDVDFLIDDFKRELEIQVEAGELTEVEADMQLIDFMIELGLIQTIAVGEDEPVEPGGLPEEPVIVDIPHTLELFTDTMRFLVDNAVLEAEQIDHQIATFQEFLETGSELPPPSFSEALTPDQAEIVFIARDFVKWFNADEIDVEGLQTELLYIAADFGIIELEDDGVSITVEPRPLSPKRRSY